ncbi:NAD(P)H-dependent oxidoreductase [Caenispirillum bisanense]|uniref:NAD(P)H dehydrogenase (Quinone) n=1 Tax=Caenispirillum bisanense TaxID=414052 RepID=A0A286GFL9_9PROT|nr:NAD(P)H-dependent oxidoreductase [Caenispirillum bisanense]SOD94298.1 NAD(P)H dehydrogenase (quinone) [Caenispirillum bisanense]
MHVLIVHAHPEPTSFNAALTDVATEMLRQAGHAVEVSDLYRSGFDPVEGPDHYAPRADPHRFAALAEQRQAGQAGTLPSAVTAEIARLERADLVIFQFPVWWHAPPAMLKGWLDRVFVSGRLYTSTKRYDRGHFRGKRALVSVTAGAPAGTFGRGGRGGDLGAILWPLHYSLHYMGFTVLPPALAGGIQGHGYTYQGAEALAGHLEERKRVWAERLHRLDGDVPLRFPGWDDWDAAGRSVAAAATC